LEKFPAYIFGASGHAKVIHSIIKEKYQEIYYIDVVKNENFILETEFFNAFQQYLNSDIYLGIGDNKIRTKLYNKLISLGFSLPIAKSKQADIDSTAKIGTGVVVCSGTFVGPDTFIGNNVILNTHSSIDHDCVIGDNTHIAVGVNLCGGVSVGINCFFGVKSAATPLVKLGDNVQVRAGSVVYHNFDSDVLIGGIPAKIIRNT